MERTRYRRFQRMLKPALMSQSQDETKLNHTAESGGFVYLQVRYGAILHPGSTLIPTTLFPMKHFFLAIALAFGFVLAGAGGGDSTSNQGEVLEIA